MAVEKQSLLFWFKNEEKYINENTIATVLQSMLNEAAGKPTFKVFLNDKSDFDDDGLLTCVLKTRIEPYMLKGAHCESVNVRLEIHYPTEDPQAKISLLNIITKCLGFITGGFKCTDEEGAGIDYTFCSNFSKDETTTPENIDSHYTAKLIIRGNMHITRSDGGILGDLVENYIVLDGEEYQVVGRTVESSCQANIDSPIKDGANQPETEINAFSFAKTLIILYRNDYICNALRSYAHGKENPFSNATSGRPELTLKEVYPATPESNGEVILQNVYYIYEIKETREAGSYMALSVTLIKKP